jgi:hypothetical protein
VTKRTEPKATIDAIVEAAYRKFSRSKTAREAMERCLKEEHPESEPEATP